MITHIIHGFFIFTSLLGILFSILLPIKYKDDTSKYLGAISLTFSLFIILCVLYWIGLQKAIPAYLQFPFVSITLVGPLFYGLLKRENIADFLLWPKWLHVTPFVVSYIWLLINKQLFILSLFLILQSVIYLFLCYRTWIGSVKDYTINWVWWCFFGFAATYIVYNLTFVNDIISTTFDYIVFLLLCIFIYSLIIKSYLNHDFVKVLKKGRLLTPTMAESVATKISEYLELSQKYLESDYKLQDLSDEIGLSTHQVSEALNTSDQGFYEVINRYRIDEAKRLLESTSNPIISIAYSSGFNNKVSFYKAFKRIVGVTPKEWRKASEMTASKSQKIL